MRIARAELYELTLPFVEPFIISGGRVGARNSIIVVLYDGEGHVGYGESPVHPNGDLLRGDLGFEKLDEAAKKPVTLG